jgi:hypothetical protein
MARGWHEDLSDSWENSRKKRTFWRRSAGRGAIPEKFLGKYLLFKVPL